MSDPARGSDERLCNCPITLIVHAMIYNNYDDVAIMITILLSVVIIV